MSSPAPNNNETIQQWCERILQAQAARQRAREEEIARQEAEFAAEMERIEAEEKAAKEAEEKRKAREQWIEEEKRREEERKGEGTGSRRGCGRGRGKEERNVAFARLVEENKKEKERATQDLEKRRKSISKPLGPNVEVLVPLASPRRKAYKSKAIISDESDDEVVEQPWEVIPRGTKRKRTIKMIAKGGPTEATIDNDTPLPPDNSQPRPACSRCVMIGRPSDCRPQSTTRPTQACKVCHQQRQQCSWSGDNAARRSRSKRVKLDDEDVYEGPAARAGKRRRVEGTEAMEQLARIAEQNQDVVNLLQRSLVVQERMLGIMVRAEKRVMEAMEGSEKGDDEDDDEDEDENGEGEEDEEEIEQVKRKEIREGKKRAE
ncbi:hypothetical protein F5890DRAFT_1559173 [Lentinula detonsa]|uniref:Uncharacterized protein n=1 Tax=Lentinula detonsa TaxID=2804962 RepID=A0AA38PP01_9AGAR|nr:hypothetical protein F5890DRAFT_1559173 [Lentinula detonsa]